MPGGRDRLRLHRLRRGALVATGLLVAGGLVAGFVLWARLSPWIEPPKVPEQDIERRWASVRTWARLDAPSAPIAPLDELAADARAAHQTLHRLLDRFGDEDAEVPRILDAEVTGPARRTMARLEAWHRNHGGLGRIDCVDPRPDALATRDALRIALASADAPDGDRAEAALALIRALSRHGTLVQAFVGDAAAVEAARVFAARGWPATDTLRETRPEPEALFTAIARDAVCNDRAVRTLAGETLAGDWTRQEAPVGADPDWPPLGLMNLAREQRVLRAHFGALVEAAHAHRGDYVAMADAMAPIEADPPRSVLVSITAIALAERVRDHEETQSRFDVLVEGLPSGVEPAGERGSAPTH